MCVRVCVFREFDTQNMFLHALNYLYIAAFDKEIVYQQTSWWGYLFNKHSLLLNTHTLHISPTCSVVCSQLILKKKGRVGESGGTHTLRDETQVVHVSFANMCSQLIFQNYFVVALRHGVHDGVPVYTYTCACACVHTLSWNCIFTLSHWRQHNSHMRTYTRITYTQLTQSWKCQHPAASPRKFAEPQSEPSCKCATFQTFW